MSGEVVKLKGRGGTEQIPQLEVQDVVVGVLSEAVKRVQNGILGHSSPHRFSCPQLGRSSNRVYIHFKRDFDSH